MKTFGTEKLPTISDDFALVGSNVRILLGLIDSGLVHFVLAPRETSVTVAHHPVEEIWYFLNGRN